MTQDDTLVSPNVSACLKPGAWKTQPALGLSPTKSGGTHRAESPNLSGSFCILLSPRCLWLGSVRCPPFRVSKHPSASLLALISRDLRQFPALPQIFLFAYSATSIREANAPLLGLQVRGGVGNAIQWFTFLLCRSASRWTSTITLKPKQLYEHRNP